MDTDAAGFVLDRVDVARLAIAEAKQVIEKFDQDEDQDLAGMLDEMLEAIERVDARVRGGTYSSP